VNLPNLITLGRLVLTVVCFACMEVRRTTGDPYWAWLAFAMFLVAAITDFVDGWLARAWGQVTQFGRLADPFADKILVCGAMVLLVGFPDTAAILPGWVVVVILAREFLVTTLRAASEAAGHAFPADRLGKWKMVVQCVAVSGLLTVLAGSRVFHEVAVVAVWLSLALTLVSGVNYIVRARRLLGGGAG
jgi:CDP-diacylglycerol--glycerol-3-phosphate 3-phosphatidyltransferase